MVVDVPIPVKAGLRPPPSAAAASTRIYGDGLSIFPLSLVNEAKGGTPRSPRSWLSMVVHGLILVEAGLRPPPAAAAALTRIRPSTVRSADRSMGRSGRRAADGRGRELTPGRHCERSEAIQRSCALRIDLQCRPCAKTTTSTIAGSLRSARDDGGKLRRRLINFQIIPGRRNHPGP